MPTITVHPSAVIESICEVESVDGSHPYSNAIGKGTDSNDYSQWYMVKGGSAITRVFYTFDLSAIPPNATITSVACSAKCQAQNSSAFRGGNNTVALRSGETTIAATEGNQAFGTSATVVTIPEATWTREQLNDCRLLIQGSRGLLGTSTSYYMRFYGADLTVTYEVPSEGPTPALYLKQNGIYTLCSSAFKKTSGVWVEQTDLGNLFDENKTYILV